MSEFRVIDHDNDNEQTAESRSEAKKKADTAREFGSEDVEIIPPNKSDRARGRPKTDGGAKVVEDGYDLPEKPPVDEDPMTWMPGEFTDNIEGTDVINRKGYEVMAHHYGIGTESECLVGPEETEYSFCRVQATATKEDGTTYTAHGSAHVDRDDDSYLLLEMADTRARKRAIAQATGVGMVAVEELMNEP